MQSRNVESQNTFARRETSSRRKSLWTGYTLAGTIANVTTRGGWKVIIDVAGGRAVPNLNGKKFEATVVVFLDAPKSLHYSI